MYEDCAIETCFRDIKFFFWEGQRPNVNSFAHQSEVVGSTEQQLCHIQDYEWNKQSTY